MANRGNSHDSEVYGIKDLERLGSPKLDKSAKEYYNEGAMDLITLRESEAAYDRYKIRPPVLRDPTGLDASTTIFRTKVTFPFGFSQSAMQALAHPDGEVGKSKAAATFGVPLVISHAKGNPYAMQISMLKNKEATIKFIKSGEWAGFLLTLYAPYQGRRLNEFRNSFGVPKGIEYPNLVPDVDVTNLEDTDESMAYDSSIEWSELLPFFHGHTKMQIWGKGTVDGGIRRGADVFKALALGAAFCFAGRRATWGLAMPLWRYNGSNGAELAPKLLYDEFKTTMARLDTLGK
ncbi:hypothetical protein BGZ61DRAFT_499784 [Ilyonectria robusta]|uniref:uncharacterized protein n=1 Tax=Ilyonectria robusta TaxID=1079257 RepID=UPI001E8D1CD4|nr:uncharacterized protein BGZ61DRAFT_499784 [Ilyonectria robusta]KAH8659638.1 hypothetical protein BGZ61DRAFT_499784 [Ilyonectria robusta]